MFISTTTLTSSPSDLTAVGQKQEACSSIGLLARQSPSDRPLTTPSSTTLSMAIRQPNWSEADTLFVINRDPTDAGGLRRVAHRQPNHFEIHQQIAMADHHPLRGGGGAGCILQKRSIVTPGCWQRCAGRGGILHRVHDEP